MDEIHTDSRAVVSEADLVKESDDEPLSDLAKDKDEKLPAKADLAKDCDGKPSYEATDRVKEKAFVQDHLLPTFVTSSLDITAADSDANQIEDADQKDGLVARLLTFVKDTITTVICSIVLPTVDVATGAEIYEL